MDLHRHLLLLLLEEEGTGSSGSLFRLLGRNRCQNYGIRDVPALEEYLRRYPQLFEVNGFAVSSTTRLSLCRVHSNQAGSCPEGSCADLHFCRFFLLSGMCQYGEHCHFGHQLETAHNRHQLERHGLQGLTITALRTLFRLPSVRQGVTVPQVCRYYNNIRGCNKQECRCLHMCQHYVLDSCKFGKRCSRNHNIDSPQVKTVLKLFGVTVSRPLSDIKTEIQKYEQDRHTDQREDGFHNPFIQGAGARPKRYGSAPNLFNGLRYSLAPQDAFVGEGARQRHSSTSNWSRNDSGSNPQRPSTGIGNGAVRTRNEQGHRGGDWDDVREAVSQIGEQIWQGYHDYSRPHLPPYNHDANYDRPDYDSYDEQEVYQSDEDDYRDDQARAPNPLPSCTISPLHHHSDAYDELSRHFTMTLGVASRVVKIDIVNNMMLASHFDRKKREMTRNYDNIQEKLLYYGPSKQKYIEDICNNGVDCMPFTVTLSGEESPIRGHWFFVNASQANKRIGRQRDNRERMMLAMKCLVGSSGRPDLPSRIPHERYPARTQSRPYRMFYSLVDNERNPKMFDIPDNSLVCPLYVITYCLV